jgi:hypothetical protein
VIHNTSFVRYAFLGSRGGLIKVEREIPINGGGMYRRDGDWLEVQSTVQHFPFLGCRCLGLRRWVKLHT